jgi:AraC-like DNA-binding protein
MPEFHNQLKTLGLREILPYAPFEAMEYHSYIKILLAPKGYHLQIDLQRFELDTATLFFINPQQHFKITTMGTESAYLIYYNRDFYCIQIHDEEVACDGLLFNNVQNMPQISLEDDSILQLFASIQEEFRLKDSSQEEMIRTYLKQILIKSVRIWKKQHLNAEILEDKQELEFFRKFTVLVENHYKEKHQVSAYAELMNVAPKTLAHKFKRLNLPSPSAVITERRILEAKRLLAHTPLSAKEIGYYLGYDDPAYFSRIFTQMTGFTTSAFRKKFQEK